MAASVILYWMPLGAGGHFVRFNGLVYEAIAARLQHRPRSALYHTALEVDLGGPHGRSVIENAWPVPRAPGSGRGVVLEGPVFAAGLDRLRWLRYEVRRWRDGSIHDADQAVGGPQLVSADPLLARRVLEEAGRVPRHTWGRRVAGTDEMWNSNSVVAWILTRSGFAMEAIRCPPGGRAPGWESGVRLARQAPAPQPS